MNKFYLFSPLVFLIFLLSGCQPVNEKMTLLDNIDKLSISESGGYGGINERFFTTLDRREAGADFETIMKKATIKNKIFNKEKPDYDIVIHYENGEQHLLHLVLGKNGNESVLMYVGHENKPYFVSPEATTELRKMVRNQEKNVFP